MSSNRNRSLKVKVTQLQKPRFPVIDAHNHLAAPFGGGWDQKPIKQLLDLLDEAGVIGFVDLDGGFDESLLYEHLDLFKAKTPDRFRVFGGVDWFAWKQKGDGFPDWAAKKDTGAGAAGCRWIEDLETLWSRNARSS